MANYEYKQHPHVEARRAKGPAIAHSKAHPSKGLSLNERIGLAVTRSVGTMWAAYAFFGLSLVSLPAAIGSGNTIVMVSWVAQTFLQLVLLPIIIVGQNIQAKASDQRAIATYEDAGAILEEAKEIQSHLGAQDAALDHLLVRVEKLEAGLKAQGK
ncbi:MAG: hypothetical protein RLZZ304_636 [Actinomycetota bacterium]|jgi:hypothetical protein